MATKQTTVQNQNVMATVAYLGLFVTGIVLLLLEKNNKFVRFHAMQSTIVFGGLFVLSFILGLVPVLGALVGSLLWIVGLILWIVLMYKAYQGEMYKLPYVGQIAEEQLSKLK
jgi:uncharacterized membrane protein